MSEQAGQEPVRAGLLRELVQRQPYLTLVGKLVDEQQLPETGQEGAAR